MSSDAALEQQIQQYRTMTGQQRLKIAIDLHEFACNIARAGIRRQFPTADDDEVEHELRRRIHLGELDHDETVSLAKSLGAQQQWKDIQSGKLVPKST